MIKFAREVCIVITTYNRTKYVNIFTKSLEKLGFCGHLIITDASNKEYFQKTSKNISEINNYRITHLKVPKGKKETLAQNMNECFKSGVKCIDTKYAMLSLDDDIPIPSILDLFEDILNKDIHEEFNGIVGDLPWFDIDKKYRQRSRIPKLLRTFINPIYRYENLYGRRIGFAKSGSLKGEKAKDRLYEMIDNMYHSMFVLVRSRTLDYIVPANHTEFKFPHFCSDYNWIFGIALAGKIQHIKKPHVVRLFTGKNLSIKNKDHPFSSFADSFLTDQWGEDSRKFIANLANLLIKYDQLSLEEAGEVAKKGYLKLCHSRLSSEIKIEKPKLTFLKGLIYYLKYKILVYKIPAFSQCRNYSKVVKVIETNLRILNIS